MVLSTVICRASSTVASLAFRSVRSPVSVRSGAAVVFFSTERLFLGSNQLRSCGSSMRFSTGSAAWKSNADQKLVSVIESEIEDAIAEEAAGTNVLDEIPEGFPFKIINTPGERTCLLKRNFEGEKIEVVVYTAASNDDEEDCDEDDQEENNDEDDQEENSIKIRIQMVVNVTKGDGVSLEFGVSAYPDEIVIDSLSIRQPDGDDKELPYEGPDFDDLDKNLQKGFHRYLEIRGIRPSFTNFLADYVAQKDSYEYLQWLKELKSFVEK